MDGRDGRPIERNQGPVGADEWADKGRRKFSSQYLDRYAVATMLSLEYASTTLYFGARSKA